VAEAANDAAFAVAVETISDFSALDDITGFTLSEQDTLVKSLIRQHVLYRYVLFCDILCFAVLYISVLLVVPSVLHNGVSEG